MLSGGGARWRTSSSWRRSSSIHAEAAPAELLRPREAQESGLVEPPLPVAAELVELGPWHVAHDRARGPVGWQVGREPGSHLGAKRLLLGGEPEVHRSSAAWNRAPPVYSTRSAGRDERARGLRPPDSDRFGHPAACAGAARMPSSRCWRVAHPEGAGRLMRAQTLKIEHACYVVTLDGERRIIQDGSILVEGQRIGRVGKAAELADAPADRVIDARHLLVTPGFVNGHMHISYAHAVRGIFLDDLGSPLPHVFRLQMAMTEEEEYQTTLLGLVELLKGGTVGFVDPGSTKFPDACLQAYEDAGIRVILGECVADREAPFPLPRYGTEEAIARTASFVRKWDGRLAGRIRAWAMPFSPETCSADLLRRVEAPGGRAGDRAHAPPRKRPRGAAGVPRAVRAQPHRVPRVERGPRPERPAVPRAGPRRRRDRVPRPDGHRGGDVPGHRRQGRPRGSPYRVGCRSSSGGACGSRSAATRPTTRTISTWCAP